MRIRAPHDTHCAIVSSGIGGSRWTVPHSWQAMTSSAAGPPSGTALSRRLIAVPILVRPPIVPLAAPLYHSLGRHVETVRSQYHQRASGGALLCVGGAPPLPPPPAPAPGAGPDPPPRC